MEKTWEKFPWVALCFLESPSSRNTTVTASAVNKEQQLLTRVSGVVQRMGVSSHTCSSNAKFPLTYSSQGCKQRHPALLPAATLTSAHCEKTTTLGQATAKILLWNLKHWVIFLPTPQYQKLWFYPSSSKKLSWPWRWLHAHISDKYSRGTYLIYRTVCSTNLPDTFYKEVFSNEFLLYELLSYYFSFILLTTKIALNNEMKTSSMLCQLKYRY